MPHSSDLANSYALSLASVFIGYHIITILNILFLYTFASILSHIFAHVILFMYLFNYIYLFIFFDRKLFILLNQKQLYIRKYSIELNHFLI